MNTPPSIRTSPPPVAAPWGALERALLRRRWGAVESALRLELVAIALLLGGFLLLQLRGPFEAIAANRGSAALAALVTALDFALPLEPAAIERHLAWSSRAQAGWVVLPALAVLAAAAGLVSAIVLAALGVLQAALLVAAARAGCAIARRRAGLPAPGSAAATARLRLPAAHFRRAAPWVAIVLKDALVLARRAGLRQGAIGVAVFGAISLLGWLLPSAPAAPGAGGVATAAAFDVRHLATFFVTLLAAAALAEWMVMLVGADPFAPFRVLPLGVGAVWRARFAWIVATCAALVAGHAMLAHGLALPARLLFLGWVAAATAGIATLGLHLALTLYPQTGPARPLLALTFGVMAIASIAVFLSGWIVLVVAVVATALRLPRWNRASAEAA